MKLLDEADVVVVEAAGGAVVEAAGGATTVESGDGGRLPRLPELDARRLVMLEGPSPAGVDVLLRREAMVSAALVGEAWGSGLGPLDAFDREGASRGMFASCRGEAE
jgi:hypothetical protein